MYEKSGVMADARDVLLQWYVSGIPPIRKDGSPDPKGEPVFPQTLKAGAILEELQRRHGIKIDPSSLWRITKEDRSFHRDLAEIALSESALMLPLVIKKITKEALTAVDLAWVREYLRLMGLEDVQRFRQAAAATGVSGDNLESLESKVRRILERKEQRGKK